MLVQKIKKLLRYFRFLFFHTKSMKSIAYFTLTAQFQLPIYQMLSCLATILDSESPEVSSPIIYIKCFRSIAY